MFLEILPAFLTPRTMFLLLFDASKDFRERWQSRQTAPDGEVLFGEVVNESTSNLMAKWMSTIHSHLVKHSKEGNPSPSLYCIGTRGDKLNEKERKALKEQMKSLYEDKEFSDIIQDVLIVDNTTSGKGRGEDPSITRLRKATGAFLKSKFIVKTTPVNWVLFRKVLQELKKNVIRKDYTIAIGAACDIPAGDVPDVLMFYHELGALLYYPHIRGLENKVILSPKWFVETLGKVFTLEGYQKGWSGAKRWSLLCKKGILVEPLYCDVWENDDDIDPQEMIQLLVCFRLAAPVETKLYDNRVKQYFLPAVLPGYQYTGQPNEAPPGYKLRSSPAHITFTTGCVPPGFFTRLATTVATQSNVKPNFENIYRNRIILSHGHPSDDIILTDLHYAIQIEVLRYVPEGSHPVPFKTVCQDVLKLLDECCQQVEETLHGYHGQSIDRSSRQVQYVCQCNCSEDIHYFEVGETQTCSEPVHCKMDRRPRPMTHNESMWFDEVPIGMYWAILNTCIIYVDLYP